jgi:hypothetical protein
MHLHVFNLTSSTLSYTCTPRRNARARYAGVTLDPHSSASIPSASRRFDLATISFDGGSTDEKFLAQHEHSLLGPFNIHLRRPLALGAMVQRLRVREDCPWDVYHTKVRRTFLSPDCVINANIQVDGRHTVYILPKRNFATFLSALPDSISLADVCLPGTHDT